MRVTGRVLTIVGLIATIIAVSPLPLHAQEPTSTPGPAQIAFSLNPAGQQDGSFFEFTADPGSTTDLSVEFSNQYTEPLTLRSFVSDAFTLTNGGLGVSDEGINTQAPTPWIDYPAETYELAPGEARDVDFTVEIPADAAPGNYVSVLVLQTAEPVPVEGTQLFDQIIRKAIAIDITVPGEETPAFTIGDVVYASGPNVPSLSIGIANTGNQRLRPAGAVSITDSSGAEVLTADVAMGSVYAGTETQLQFVLQQPLPAGEYGLTLDLSDEATGAEASVLQQPFTVTDSATPTTDLIAFADLALTPGPDAATPQFASISGTIVNGGAAIPSARLTIHAFKDGEEVESFPLIPALSLPQGETPIQQRYIPGTGFTTGTWSFELTLESVDTASGAATLLVTQPLEQTIVIP
jgi:hypothetical protein